MLTDAQCRNAVCPPDRKQGRFADSGGMYLQVSPAGSKRWFLKYRIAGVEKQLPAAKKMAYQEAGEECSRRGMEVLTLNERSAGTTWTDGMAKTELTFRCLRSDDSEFKRPRFEKAPDIVIENR